MMGDQNKIQTLFFFHSTQAPQAQKIDRILSAWENHDISVLRINETSDLSEIAPESLETIIILYTPELERDDTFYRLIKLIESHYYLERFFILPQKEGTRETRFPIQFHTVRFLENHLFFYPSKENSSIDVDNILEPLRQSLQASIEQKTAGTPVLENRPKLVQHLRQIWKNPVFRTGVFLIPFFAALIILIIMLFPGVANALTPNKSTVPLISPPEMNALWINETFDQIDTNNTWTESHHFKGTNYANVDCSDSRLDIHAEPVIVDDIYQLESIPHWPIEQLQGFRTTFSFQSLQSQDAAAFISFQIKLVDNPDYLMGCWASPHAKNGTVQCFIKELDHTQMISSAETFSLDEKHTLSLVFNPQNYSAQFFLDERYYGQAKIPSVQYWRGRDFNFSVNAEMKNLNLGSFVGDVDQLWLAHQP